MSHIRYINKWTFEYEFKKQNKYPHIAHGIYKQIKKFYRICR